MRSIKQFKFKILITLVVLVYAIIMYVFKMPCLILHFTGSECLGCGMTRAFLSVLELDFVKAFSYHGMFWSLPILYLYFLYDGRLFNNKFLNISVIVIIAIGFVINWLI